MPFLPIGVLSKLMDPVITFIASLIIGIIIGILSGLLGIGGGTLLVPIFKLGYMMNSIACTATSLFTIIPTSVSGAITHLRNKTCIPRLGVAAGIGGMITSPIGVWLATLSPEWMIMVAAALIIFYSAYTMLKKAFKLPKSSKKSKEKKDSSTGATAGTNAGATAATPSPTTPPVIIADPIPEAPSLAKRQLLYGALIGLVAGLCSGYVGVGGGFIMVPLMISLLHIPMKLTSGTSLIAVMLLAIPGVIYQAILGNINWIAGIAVALGSIPGAVLGAKLIPRVPERTLRFLFGGFLIFAGIILMINELGIFG